MISWTFTLSIQFFNQSQSFSFNFVDIFWKLSCNFLSCNELYKGKVPELTRLTESKQGVPMVSRRGQILLAVCSFRCVFCAMRLTTVSAQAPCQLRHRVSPGTVSPQGLCRVFYIPRQSFAVKFRQTIPFTVKAIEHHFDRVFSSSFCLAEIPADAAQDALPKNQILQHPKPAHSSHALSNGFTHHSSHHQPERRSFCTPLPSPPVYQSSPHGHDDLMQQHQHSGSGSCGPLPPISSISPANHGSPVSSAGDPNDSVGNNSYQQQLLEYFSQAQLQQPQPNGSEIHQPLLDLHSQTHQPMDYQCDPSSLLLNYGNNGSNGNGSAELESGDDLAAWLNAWLAQNGGTTGPDHLSPVSVDVNMPDGGEEFKQEEGNGMQTEDDAYQEGACDMDQSNGGPQVVLPSSSSGHHPGMDQSFLDFFDDFAAASAWNGTVDLTGNGVGGYLGGGGGGQTGPVTPMYWTSEAEQMLWTFFLFFLCGKNFSAEKTSRRRRRRLLGEGEENFSVKENKTSRQRRRIAREIRGDFQWVSNLFTGSSGNGPLTGRKQNWRHSVRFSSACFFWQLTLSELCLSVVGRIGGGIVILPVFTASIKKECLFLGESCGSTPVGFFHYFWFDLQYFGGVHFFSSLSLTLIRAFLLRTPTSSEDFLQKVFSPPPRWVSMTVVDWARDGGGGCFVFCGKFLMSILYFVSAPQDMSSLSVFVFSSSSSKPKFL